MIRILKYAFVVVLILVVIYNIVMLIQSPSKYFEDIVEAFGSLG